MAELVEEGPRPGGSWQKLGDTWRSGADLASELTPGEVVLLDATVKRVSELLDARGVEHEFKCTVAPDPEFDDWTLISITVRTDLPMKEILGTVRGQAHKIMIDTLPPHCVQKVVFLFERPSPR